MNREYFVRGERKTVEEIDNVVAIKVTPNERGEAMAGVSSFGTGARTDAEGMSEDTLDAFEKAQWLFVEPSPETMRALDARAPVENTEDSGKLVRRLNGRFAIVTRGSMFSSSPTFPLRRPSEF